MDQAAVGAVVLSSSLHHERLTYREVTSPLLRFSLEVVETPV
jgi:hypothetical protein